VNPALPDADLDAFVNDLADKIAGFDAQVVSETKALIDATTLPSDDHMLAPYHAFFGSVARLTGATADAR
jgi:hypothetical protein